MEYKCLKNYVNIYYYHGFGNKLVLYIDEPYYIILFLLIEMYLSHFEVEYKFHNLKFVGPKKTK